MIILSKEDIKFISLDEQHQDFLEIRLLSCIPDCLAITRPIAMSSPLVSPVN